MSQQDEPLPAAAAPRAPDPMEQIQQSRQAAQGDGNAGLLFLATASASGQPSVRTLLLRKIVDRRLLIVFSKYHGKWKDLRDNHEQFEVLLWYPSIGHQYRIRGHFRLAEAADLKACWEQQPPAIKRVDMSYNKTEALAPGDATTDQAVSFRQRVEALSEDAVASAPPPDHVVAAWLEATNIERVVTSPADRLHDRVQHVWAADDQTWQAQSVIP
jgi:pyridoxine/pyridoxamine 5'-phosphate oxidase